MDLDNSPHVPFFRPIIERLRERDYDLLVTARDAYQVRELIDLYRVPAKIVGRHYGKHKVLKTLGTFWRAFALMHIVRRQRPDLAVCHGSRALLLACTLLRIPAVAIMDYEFGAELPFVKPRWLLVPSVLTEHKMGFTTAIVTYPGLKEDVYLSMFEPDPTLRDRLGIAAGDVLIVVRPPASEAHYHSPEGDKLFTEVLNRFANKPGIRVLLLPRNKRQEIELHSAWAGQIAARNILIPAQAEDGLNLIWNSDLVISGGGTMNREAAALGVPVYSIFRGKIGAVDRYLAEQGRLILLKRVEDLTKINCVRRKTDRSQRDRNANPGLDAIIRNLVSMVEFKDVAASAEFATEHAIQRVITSTKEARN